jgi:hypothetical protein
MTSTIYGYCVQDVAVEREMSRKAPPLSEEEQGLWVLDALVNMRGFYTDSIGAWRKLSPNDPRSDATQAVSNQVSFEHDGKFLWMRLPSGRQLAYPEAYLKDTDREKVVVFKDNASGRWADCRNGAGAYGGLWIENLVQAVARDLFAAAMLRLENAGYRVVAHVHDEIVCEVPEGFGSEEEFMRLITELPDWARGVPVAAKPRSGHRFSK